MSFKDAVSWLVGKRADRLLQKPTGDTLLHGPMLARYQMKRGVPASELPVGIRQDTRKHTRHVLRPPSELVTTYLADPSDAHFETFRMGYLKAVRARHKADAQPFDQLANLARRESVFLGCSCPTAKNPDVRRCHTWMVLELMADLYPGIDVRFP